MLKAALRPNAVMIFQQKPKGCKQKEVKQRSLDNLSTKYAGKGMSQSARERVKRTVANWSVGVLASQRIWQKNKGCKRRYFIMMTLTLPSKQVESDEEVKRKYLNAWLQKLCRFQPDIHYLWVAETQANGNIHFHVVADKWVDFRWVQRSWNETLENGTYIDTFAAKFGHRNPPSTKVTGQKNMKDPALYITKYISKDEGRRVVDGHCWYCCDKLKELERVAWSYAYEIEDEIVRNFAAELKNVYYGEKSTAYYFTEPIAANSLLEKLFWRFDFMFVRQYEGLFAELAECFPEDLPLEECAETE